MPKPKAPESFDKAEYSGNTEAKDKYATVYEIIHYMPREYSDKGITVNLHSNKVKLAYQSYEMHLSDRDRKKVVEDECKEYMNQTVKYLKKEFREKRGETLEMKELKDLADSRIEKAGLNSRWMYISWKVFEISEDDPLRRTDDEG